MPQTPPSHDILPTYDRYDKWRMKDATNEELHALLERYQATLKEIDTTELTEVKEAEEMVEEKEEEISELEISVEDLKGKIEKLENDSEERLERILNKIIEKTPQQEADGLYPTAQGELSLEEIKALG